MFTGLVTEKGEVASLRRTGGGAVLSLKAGEIARDAVLGDSIAVDGACLTVTRINGNLLDFDLSTETLDSTTLGGLGPGDKVNLEPSLRANGKLGGHFVTGHVDAVGTIKARNVIGGMYRFEVEAPPVVMDLLVPKGSVTVNGTSLTVVDVLRDTFTLMIIPHTAGVTTMGAKGPGDKVNLETDIIGKYIMKFLRRGERDGGAEKNAEPERGLMDALRKSGFI